MQIIYISNRPEILSTTLKQVARFMPFIKEVLVLCPAGNQAKIICPPGLRLQLLSDDLFEEVFSDPKHWRNHVFRNYLLRVKLLEREEVQAEFIMSDDDYRPIRPLDISFFKRDGKYCSYYFYDLSHWTANATEFDKGQQSTYVLLHYFGFSTLCFASHMPQMINKQLFRKAAAFFSPHSSAYPICEWTSYFNYNHKIHPDQFHPPEIYQTLAWPELPLIWPWYVKPEAYSFENYCPSLYKNDGLFNDLAECPDLHDYDQLNLSKLQRLYEIEIGRRELPYHKNDPLRKGFARSVLAKITWLFSILLRRAGLKARNGSPSEREKDK